MIKYNICITRVVPMSPLRDGSYLAFMPYLVRLPRPEPHYHTQRDFRGISLPYAA